VSPIDGLTWAGLRHHALTLALALGGALACLGLGTPLPWFIGPLLGTAAAAMSGLPVRGSAVLRNAGLWVIGTALGLYFTPEVVAMLPGLAPVIAASTVWALACGYGYYHWLWRANRALPGLTRETAFFSSAIGGASEMALLADRRGGRVDLVASAHSLRIMLVVLTVPFAMQALGPQGTETAALAARAVPPAGLAMLCVLTALGGLILRALRVPNPWMLGALAVSVLLAAHDAAPSGLPREMSNAAQLFLGCALGARFQPDFLRAAPRWMLSVAAGTLAMIVASALFAWALATAAGQDVATLVLGTCPGGMTEMAITAKVLHLGVPVVTVLQLLRYLAVMLLTGRLWGWEAHRLRQAPGGTDPSG
jgi:membrane AbrB-like protein